MDSLSSWAAREALQHLSFVDIVCVCVMDSKVEEGEGDELGGWDWHVYTSGTVYKTDN